MNGIVLVDVEIKDRVTRAITTYNNRFYCETKEAMINIAKDAIASVEIPFWTGALYESFKVTDVIEEEQGFYDRKIIEITNTAPHAKFVNGPTKPHFVTFKHHPELKQWADDKLDIGDRNFRGLWVYKTRYPSETGGQFMTKISQYIEEHAENRIRNAVNEAIIAYEKRVGIR